MDLRRGRPASRPTGARHGGALRDVALAVTALIVLMAGAIACGDSPPGGLPEPQPSAPSVTAAGDIAGADITGPVAGAAVYDASPQGGAGPTVTLLIEDGRGAYDKASITTTTETTWYDVVDGALVGLDTAPDAATLTGRSVAVAFVGPVAESYPVQATAGWVVLLPAAD